MNEFIAKYEKEISGVVSGLDRVVFRGTLRALCGRPGMEQYLAGEHVLYKDFGKHVEKVSEELKKASLVRAERQGRPIQYVASAAVSKEEIARRIAGKQPIREGLICVITSVEPCWSFDIYRNRQTRHLDLVQRQRKCLHIYQYWNHPKLGFLNARIQTWFPFRIQICINGREWLGRQMDKAGRKYLRVDNCFAWMEDFKRGQRLLDAQLKTDWPKLLDGIARELNPRHEQMFKNFRVHYYWSVYQSEWAVDVVFRDAQKLRRLYPKLVHHGMTTFGSVDVLRFLGRRVPASGAVPANFAGEVLSNIKQRPEGIRLKHGVNGNSVKVYDKAFTTQGSVLRFETTIHNGDDIRVYRPKEGDPEGQRDWRVMRRGVADLYRRAQVSHQAAQRYMDAMASVDDDTTLEELTRRLQNRVRWGRQQLRGLRLFDSADRQLLEAVSRGEFTITGVRNRDLQKLFFQTTSQSPKEARRRSAWVTRRLRLLRAHGLLYKVVGTHRYQVSKPGRRIMTAILTACRATVAQLTALVA